MRSIARSVCVWIAALFVLSACGAEKSIAPVFHAEDNPPLLSDWQVVEAQAGQLVLADGVVPYDLNSALFTDYAHKLRTVWVPAGEAAAYSGTDVFDFPVGTIISKTFYYPRAEGGEGTVIQAKDTTPERLNSGFSLSGIRLIETRLLVRREKGWTALPYVWNAEQTDAKLKRVGDILPLKITNLQSAAQDFTYVVPNANQCAGCHATNATTRAVQPIGPKARHLNKSFDYASGADNQLAYWQAHGILSEFDNSAPKNADWQDVSETLDARARSYLDINCSHCHNKVGPADTSGLLLEPESPVGPSLGLCKLPIAAGTGTGDRKFGIVPGRPDESIFTYRMESTNPAVMMPELGRSLAHKEGVELIAEWIAEMDGACD